MKKFLLMALLVVSSISNAQFFENFDDPSVANPTGSTWELPSGTWRIFDNGVGSLIDA